MIGAIKGIVHPKKEKIMALFIQSHVVSKSICSYFYVEPPFFHKMPKVAMSVSHYSLAFKSTMVLFSTSCQMSLLLRLSK